MKAKWNPEQYEKFKEQRSRPFFDLMAQIDRRRKISRVIDLGCGTGELTRHLFDELRPARLEGIDASPEMLSKAQAYRTPGLEFKLADISDLGELAEVDLVFSNAALQWVPDHELLFPHLLKGISEQGQIAVQMPYNFDHPSHSIAKEVAHRLFPDRFPESGRQLPVLRQERYAEILFHNGFRHQTCRLEIYGHAMPSGADVVEWTKGTTLTAYQAKLTEPEYQKYLEVYRRDLVAEIGEGPYYYAFKRLLIWGRRP